MELPQGFVDQISRYQQLLPLLEGLKLQPEVSVRLNPSKRVSETGLPLSDRVGWWTDGYYLTERPRFTFNPLLHQGAFYVQDASSMAVAAAVSELAPPAPVRYLDACAAPGGKTTGALAALPQGSVVVANEYDFRRAEVLAENVAKWGNPNVFVSRGDTSRLSRLSGVFDIVAVDAPCSGEGMMRKDQQAVEQWSPRLVADCAATQRQIVGNVWSTLRPGGYLIYSTCTFNRQENEENLQWIVDEFGAEPVELKSLERFSEIAPGIDTPLPCYRFLPGRVKGEGLFLAAVRKPGDADAATIKSKPQKPDVALLPLKRWLDGDFTFVNIGGEVYALPESRAAEMFSIAKSLDVVTMGVRVATVKGRDLIPDQGLALSSALNAGAFPSVDVDEAVAVRYLRREPVPLPEITPKGYVLLTYAGLPLGFVKNLGNRSNNLYPKNWRILSSAPSNH